MIHDDQTIEILDACDKRRDARRSFLRGSGTAALFASTTLMAACSEDNNTATPTPTPPVAGPTPTPTPPATALTDADILNFALNLEYLEAQFYSFAAFGVGLPENLINGPGARGQAVGGRAATFTDPLVRAYAREIANDERQHVAFLRTALGAAAVSQPAINIGVDFNGAFSATARLAGIANAAGTFDAYANDENFLLAAFIFEDVGVTAYKGASPLISSKVFLEAAAGILAAEAYHAGLIRTVLYGKGVQTPSLRTNSVAISNLRDSLDGPTDVDQGVTQIGNMSNIVPTDANGIVFSRTPGDVLNIVYATADAASQGGFFPNGTNGTIRLSTIG